MKYNPCGTEKEPVYEMQNLKLKVDGGEITKRMLVKTKKTENVQEKINAFADECDRTKIIKIAEANGLIPTKEDFDQIGGVIDAQPKDLIENNQKTMELEQAIRVVEQYQAEKAAAEKKTADKTADKKEEAK